MTRWYVTFNLHEAAIHLRQLIAEIEAGEFEECADLRVDLGHISWHLCRAWHARRLTSRQEENLTDHLYDQITSRVPNWQGAFRMLDGWHLPGLRQPPAGAGENWTNWPFVIDHLNHAAAILERLVAEIDNAATLPEDAALEDRFARCARHLLLAWHLGEMADEHITRRSDTEWERIATTVPQWYCTERLVPADWSPDLSP